MPRDIDFDTACKALGLKVDPTTAKACRVLEMCGLRFLVDFGINNAIDMVCWRFIKWQRATETPVFSRACYEVAPGIYAGIHMGWN